MKKTLLALSVAALAAGITSTLTKLVQMLVFTVLYVRNEKAPLTKLTM